MFGSTLALTMGLMFLAAARFSGNPSANGFIVLVGILLVASSCAMHFGAVLDRLLEVRTTVSRVIAKVAVWTVVSVGTAWLIGQTPRDDVLIALMLVPTAVGIVGVVVARDIRWLAIAYQGAASILTVLAAWTWLDDRLA